VAFIPASQGNHSSTSSEDVGNIRGTTSSLSWPLGQCLSLPEEPQPGSYSLLQVGYHLSHSFLHAAHSSPWWWRQYRPLKQW
jgi:hypothetical protein